MKYMNKICADAGTASCPCPLAETGDCLLCSRLAGKDKCDCSWCGLCIYNEFIQNDKVIRNVRNSHKAAVLRKIWYTPELLVLVLGVDKSLALNATSPGSFVFLNGVGTSDDSGGCNGCVDKEFFSVPVSVMKSDVQKGQLFLALRVISAKTKRIAETEDYVFLRGVYRNGLLGGEISKPESAGMPSACKNSGLEGKNGIFKREKWLIFTKGVGISPAINLISGFHGEKDVDMVIDTEKITESFVQEALSMCIGDNDDVNIAFASLADVVAGETGDERGANATGNKSVINLGNKGRKFNSEKDEKNLKSEKLSLYLRIGGKAYDVESYDRIAILASDYYIAKLAEKFKIPPDKLIFSNNFRMCCGEGICGACSHTDASGNTYKMCKCRQADVKSLIYR